MTAANMASGNKRLAGATVGIPPRQVKFDFAEDAPRYPVDNNATASLFLAMLSGFFPPGERFFVESVRRYRNQITDPELKAAVSGFIGQEAIHGREHERLNEYLLERGIDTNIPERAVKIGLWFLEKLPPKQQLACTTMMEHFTATLAEQLLTDKEFTSKFDPQLLPMWQWHALEELEHKSVAYDVHETVGNDAKDRRLAVAYVTATMVPAALISWVILLAKEKKLTDVKDIKKGVTALFGKRGFVSRILPQMPVYTARSFHPAKHNTKNLEQSWRERLFGKNGELTDIWHNKALV